MNVLLWVLQILAALLYGASGVMKVFMFEKRRARSPDGVHCLRTDSPESFLDRVSCGTTRATFAARGALRLVNGDR